MIRNFINKSICIHRLCRISSLTLRRMEISVGDSLSHQESCSDHVTQPYKKIAVSNDMSDKSISVPSKFNRRDQLFKDNPYAEKLKELSESFGKNRDFNLFMYNDDNVLNSLSIKLKFIKKTVDWDLNMDKNTAICNYKLELQSQTISGTTTSTNKKSSKKEAAREILSQLEPPSFEEMEEITKWVVSSHKNVIKAHERIVDKSFGGNGHYCKIQWKVENDMYYGEGHGRTPKEAELYAHQDLFVKTFDLKKTANPAINKIEIANTKTESTQPVQEDKETLKRPLQQDGVIEEELSKADASQMNALRNSIATKMKVKQVEHVMPCAGGYQCSLTWSWMNTDGSMNKKVICKLGSSKAMAKACASKAMLVEIGTIEDVTYQESKDATEIRELIHQNIYKAVELASVLIERSNCSVWRLFLPQLWTILVQMKIQPLVEQITKAMLSEQYISQINPQLVPFGRIVPSDLWEEFLKASITITDEGFGKYVLWELKKLKIDPRYFHSLNCKEYYQHQSWLLAVEFLSSINSELLFKRTSDRLHEGYLIRLDATKVQLPLITFSGHVTSEYFKNTLKEDDIVLILPLVEHQIVTESWMHAFLGSVNKHRSDNYVVTIKVGYITKLDYREGDHCFRYKSYGLYHLHTLITHNRMMEALQGITHSIFPINVPTNMSLSNMQRQACVSALTNAITLIQGPPGTGKTHVACAIVDCWNRMYPSERILAVADSNVAADNLIEGLSLRNISALRIGSSSESDLQEDPIKNLYRYPQYIQLRQHGLHKEANSLRVLLFTEAVKKHKIIIATCVGSGNEILMNLTFPFVIIDECAQSIEASNLIPVGRGCRSLVLIGDHKQLRPTIISPEASKYGLNISLLERLVNENNTPVYVLDVQRRMHPSIAEFPNHHFYNGIIKNEAVNDMTRPRIDGLRWPAMGYNICFIDISNGTPNSNFETNLGTSKYNSLEITCVLAVLKSFLKTGNIRERHIGVLTPYDAQKSMLRRQINQLEEIRGYEIDVDSVDGFQGKEKELIIFSAVRSNLAKETGFVKDPRRMNVMLTRARRGLVVVGDQFTLLNDIANWNPFLNWVYSRQLNIHVSQLNSYLNHPDKALPSCSNGLVTFGQGMR